MAEKLTIHPANDMFGRWWAIFQNGEEVKSFDRDSWSLDEVKERLKERFAGVEIEVSGEKKIG